MRPYAGVIIASFLLLGCASSPAELCKKMEELNAKPDKCESRLEVQKAQEPDVYKRTVLCIKGATNQNQAEQCMTQ